MKVIDHQKIDITDEEYAHYQNLVKQFGQDEFRGLFRTNERGLIVSIAPSKPISWLVLFFVQNVMISQHLRENDTRLDDFDRRLRKLGV